MTWQADSALAMKGTQQLGSRQAAMILACCGRQESAYAQMMFGGTQLLGKRRGQAGDCPTRGSTVEMYECTKVQHVVLISCSPAVDTSRSIICLILGAEFRQHMMPVDLTEAAGAIILFDWQWLPAI